MGTDQVSRARATERGETEGVVHQQHGREAWSRASKRCSAGDRMYVWRNDSQINQDGVNGGRVSDTNLVFRECEDLRNRFSHREMDGQVFHVQQ